MALAKVWSVTLDCDDPGKLAEFWAGLLDGKVAYTSDEFVGVETPGGMWIGAYRIEGYEPPQWPEGGVGKQFHLDLSVADLDEGEKAAIGLGAIKSEHQAQPDRWRVLLDPAGHPFCLTNMGQS